MTLGE